VLNFIIKNGLHTKNPKNIKQHAMPHRNINRLKFIVLLITCKKNRKIKRNVRYTALYFVAILAPNKKEDKNRCLIC
jgi:hypothetical protein